MDEYEIIYDVMCRHKHVLLYNKSDDLICTGDIWMDWNT